MLKIFLIFFVIEIALVVISGNFSKELKIGFEDGKFTVYQAESHYDLQEKITEEFQIDEYYSKHDVEPKIYGSSKIYDFFKNIFGKATAVATFQLLRMLLIVDILILLMAVLIRKSLLARPSKPQIIFELLYTSLEQFVTETLGKDKAYYTPYIVSLFLFLWVCNMIGMIPIPGFMEPTRNLNVPLGLGFLSVVIVHASAVKFKGAWKHLQNYINPVKNPLFLLDIVGEVSKVVSISFRLFGNILGGAIIILVVSSLVSYVVFPVGLNLFFGMFVGTIQAFVFTMLALTYIGVEIAE
ncbi:MAG: F0F1 ATP synthase subunit A [Candidatus Cloacimonetes bacterium]|nr:F0F1 ATP synthase subunit A [Candidatus Cloacimonadota bacterium]MCF7813841.1 F0F1 ATP synthase subunit A [Candidatus Cloacimonadota bacterium]MCF7868279.1 F0F1 ATP synthase subunit A [Candidatus Cloacimonadota bacterium]MCF7883747.1 F0F1 ATP synthase subunit A [Candidatus Cloacimonadota bacterium]